MKRFYIIASLLIGALAFSACEDQDATPVFQEPTEFVLNEPVLKNNFIDLATSESVELAVSQPDYGFTAATTYKVQISKSGQFTSKFDEKKITGDYVELDVDFSTARMNVPATELAIALTQLRMVDLVAEDPDIDEDGMKAMFPYETSATVRVVASLTASGKGEITSNTVSFASFRCPYSLPEVYVPKEYFIVGQYNGWDWGSAFDMIPANGNATDGKGKSGTYWRLIYLPEGGFKVNGVKEWDGGEVGYVENDPLYTYVDNAGSGLKGDDGNMAVTKAGWYLVVVRMTVEGRDIIYKFEVNEPNVYLMGSNAPVNDWSDEHHEENLFTVPADADGDFVSPAFAHDTDGDGGVRAHVRIDGYDWWKTEFIPLAGKLEYRGTGGDQERVNGTKGQKLYINFTKGTGEIK